MKKIFILGVSVILWISAYSQLKWSRTDLIKKVFIKNIGQVENIANRKILFTSINNSVEKFYVTKKGIIIEIDTLELNGWVPTREDINDDEKELKDLKPVKYFVFSEWENINPDVKIVPLDKAEGYFTFGNVRDKKANGYKKILFKNAYPNIDILYSFPKDSSGYKYEIILHPGADISDLKLNYYGDVKKVSINKLGNIIISTPLHFLIDHAPQDLVTESGKTYPVFFHLTEKNLIEFKSQTSAVNENAQIDPWVSGIQGYSNAYAFEVDYDYDGNVYVYVDLNTYDFVQKYSPTGSLVWTHNINNINTNYEGNFMVDRNLQKIYISEGFNGSGARTYRIDYNGNPDGFMSNQNGSFREMWCLVFDCSSNRVMGFGGGTNSNLNGGLIDPNTGAVQTANFTGLGSTDQDIVHAVTDPAGNLYCVYAHVSGYCDHYLLKVNSSMNGHDWMVVHNGVTGFEECSNHPPGYSCWNGSNAFNALAANDEYLYLYDGATIAAYDKTNGTQLATISTGMSNKQQGGIAVDDCNTIYVGGNNGNILVYTFDGSSFSGPIDNISLNWPGSLVWDVMYDKNFNLIYASGKDGVAAINATHSYNCSSASNSFDNSYFCVGNQVNAVTTVNTTLPNPVINYTWSDQNGNILQQHQNTTNLSDTLFNMQFGMTYRIKVQINPPCGPISFDSIVVPASISDTILPIMVNCYGENSGSATVQITEGIAPYTFSWSNNDNDSIAENLTAGTYFVTINGGCGLSTTDSITITQPPLLTTSISNIDTVLCYGDTNGTATVNAQGGVSPYTYLWDNGETTPTATSLVSQLHFVTVTDAHGCTAIDSAYIPTPQPLQIILDSIVDISCFSFNDGAVYISPSGGTPPYNFNWSTGDNTQNIENLVAGTYYLTLTDYHNCQVIDSFVVTEPPLLTTSIDNIVNVNCNGENNGQATVEIQGGTSPYNVSWDNSITTPGNTLLNAGTHTVTVTDAHGCVTTDTVTITEPPLLTIVLDSSKDVLCYEGNDGQAYFTASGGTPPYSYLWSNGLTTDYSTTLTAGIYTITVTDDHGCSAEAQAVINQPDELIVTTPPNIQHCNGLPLTVEASVTGGTLPYTYTWSNGSTSPTLNITPTEDMTVSVTVTDANGCTATSSTVIDVNDPVQFNIFVSRDSVCKGDRVILSGTVTGGVGSPYSITNQNGDIVTFPVMLTVSHDTTIILTATDACGSHDADTVVVNVYPMPFVMFAADTIAGCQPFTVNFNVTEGADQIHNHIWNFGDNDNINLSLGPNPHHTYNDYGVYTVTLMYTTNKGCKDTVQIEDMITVYKKPKAEFVNDPQVGTVVNPVIDFINQSEDNVLNFWSFGDGDSSIQVNPRHKYPNVANTYQAVLIVESDKGCKDTAIANIEIQDVPVFYAPTAFTPDNDGINDLFFVIARNIDMSKEFYLSVYDRWGELVWATNKYDPENPSKYGWDGTVKGGSKQAPPDVYVWRCVYYTKDGNSHNRSGNVTLIR